MIKLSILYIATSFPKPSNGDTIYTDLAETIKERGHEIVVVVADQYENKKLRSKINIERGFEVLRVSSGAYYNVGMIKKGITTLLLPLWMKRALRQHLLNRKFDLILFESPPITNFGIVTWAKKKFNCLAYLMLKDIFPQNAVDLGIMRKDGLIYGNFHRKEKMLYEAADIIGCMSKANREYLLKNNQWLHENKIEVFPNSKKINRIGIIKNDIRTKYNIPREACVFLFGGNMGKPQYLELLSHAVIRCKDNEDIFFIFVGRGTDKYKIVD